jgi:hypothetical protein
MKLTNQEIYAAHGIEYKAGKILSPVFGWIEPLLKRGNAKTGKAVYTWSTLPGNIDYSVNIDGQTINVKGTCCCFCDGCYATKHKYQCESVVRSLAINTYLTVNNLDFVRRAIAAQLEAIGRGEIRIHASGDFATSNAEQYVKMWHDIARSFPAFRFWTYTKVRKYESAFDDLKNANIVKSIVPHIGVNFGKCEYIINAYLALKAKGESVYICKCGIDKTQHCERCGVCAAYKYVLFVEHSTGYNAEKDPLFPALCELVNNQ